MRNGVTGFLVLRLSLLLAAAELTAEEADKQTPSKAELQQLYTEFLTERDYRTEVDGDGDVIFELEGHVYFIAVAENDPQYFRIVLANIWPIKSGEERIQVLKAADETNALIKAAKVFTIQDNVWVTTELFVNQPEDFKGVFTRAISCLEASEKHFYEQMLTSSP